MGGAIQTGEQMNHIAIELISATSTADRKKAVCESILRDLPEWFGIEEATLGYIEGVADKLMVIASVSGQAVGFLSAIHHNQYTSEIYVIGVKRKFHRRGIGTMLLTSIANYLKNQETEYLMVKTLGPSHPDEGYRKTRLFYEQVGFRPLEELIELWGKENPCLLMVMRI